MKKPSKFNLSALVCACVAGITMVLPQHGISGDLEPPSGPAPTMHSLDEIYDKLITIENTVKGGCTDCTAPVPKTGQINTYGSGDDGDLQKGITWDSNSRFTENNNGTVTDNLTGLIWTKKANCGGEQAWADGLSYCNNLADSGCELSVTDGSSPGDWRLPNVRELQSLIDFGNFDPALPANHPFESVQIFFYWVSSSTAQDSDFKWSVSLRDGTVIPDSSIELGSPIPHWIWCVRSGQ